MNPFLAYFSQLRTGKMVLWCYLIWYLTMASFYFDPAPGLWINAMGISAVIGTGLILSVGGFQVATKDRWQVMRLYLMPLCVSSFSALIKGQGFVLVFSPKLAENLIAAGCCGIFVTAVLLLRKRNSTKGTA